MSRRVLLLSIFVGALVALPRSTVAGDHAPPGNQIYAPQLAIAAFQAERGEDGSVLKTLEPAMQADAYGSMPAERAYQVAMLYAAAAYNLGEWENAHRALLLATGQPQATVDDWDTRFNAAILAGDATDAFLTFRRLIDRAPLQSFSGRQLDRFNRLLGTLPNAREARLALGREMEREHWQPPFVFYDPSRVWLDYAEALQATGDKARARAVAAKITDPTVIMAMQTDRRFDDLVAATPSLRDADEAAGRYLTWAQGYARDNPRMLSGRIAVARALDILNRPAEALPILDDADRAVGHGPRRDPSFDDLTEEPVLQYWRSGVLMRLGRNDEGIGARTAAAACHCSSLGGLMLARALLDLGRLGEAQHWLDGLSESGLGLEDRMTLAQTRVCVAAERGKPSEATDALDFLAQHEGWAPEAAINGLICAGEFDRAAQAVIRQLGDPQRRLDALAGLQAYSFESGDGKAATKVRAGWARLAAMPSVQAAAEKVGRFKVQPATSGRDRLTGAL